MHFFAINAASLFKHNGKTLTLCVRLIQIFLEIFEGISDPRLNVQPVIPDSRRRSYVSQEHSGH
jgi:hypothetical protein